MAADYMAEAGFVLRARWRGHDPGLERGRRARQRVIRKCWSRTRRCAFDPAGRFSCRRLGALESEIGKRPQALNISASGASPPGLSRLHKRSRCSSRALNGFRRRTKRQDHLRTRVTSAGFHRRDRRHRGGVSRAHQAKLFEPFLRPNRPAGNGSASRSRQIVNSMAAPSTGQPAGRQRRSVTIQIHQQTNPI